MTPIQKWLEKMIEKKLLTKQQSENALRENRGPASHLFEVLIKRNYISEHDLISFLSSELGIPVLKELNFKISKDILNLIPLELAKRYHIVPLLQVHKTLTVAVSNPLDLIVSDDLAALTGRKIKPVLVRPSLLEEVIRKLYSGNDQESGKSGEQSLKEILKDLNGSLSIEHVKKAQAVDLTKETEEVPVIKVANYAIVEAIKRRSSDLFIEPWEKHMRVRCRVDGILEEIKTLPVSMSQSIISRIKVMSNLDIAEHRIPQDGRFKAKIQKREVDFRVSVIPTTFGEKICIRILDKKSETQNLDALGFPPLEVEKLRAAALKPHGMILVTGPTGSGKTTTLYAILNCLHTPDKNITTVEDPVEYQVHGINQVNVREAVGLTFASALRAILRQDPNIIMIGEIRDLETMDTAVKSALTGHLVLSTLHTNDAASSVVRMVNMGIEPFLIVSSVHLITAQRLIRRLCANCKEPQKPSAEVLKILSRNAPKDAALFKPRGCFACRYTGYSGRRVITEVLALTPTVKELILKRATGDQIKQIARKEGMTTLRESGVQKVLSGETTLDEVLRITASDMELTC